MFGKLVENIKKDGLVDVILPDGISTLGKDKIKHFDSFVEELVCYADSIQIRGKPRRMYQMNPYSTILSGVRWSQQVKDMFEKYVYFKYGGVEGFNKWIFSHKYLEGGLTANAIKFVDDEFNLVFIKIERTYLECYAKEYRDNRQVRLIAESKDAKCYDVITRYLREIRHVSFLRNILDDKKVIEALMYHITCGKYIINEKIKLISNSNSVYCLAYIPIKYYSEKETPAWDDFMQQIKNEKMAKQFMAWIYGVFVDNDYSRQVLWIEGPGYCGKSTIIRVIGDFLLQFNKCLFQTVADKLTFNTFSLEPFENCRLAAFAEANEPDFFKRRDILTMTGGDYVSINRKNKPTITKKLQVKVIVHSNYAPKIDYSLIHEKTRLLHVALCPEKVAQQKWRFSPEEFESKLLKEFKSFLAKCRPLYAELMNSKGLINNE